MSKKRTSIGVTVLIFTLLLASSSAHRTSEHGEVVDHTTDFSVDYTLTCSQDDVTFQMARGYDVVSLTDGTYGDDIGKPMMPQRQVRIALPAGIKAQQVTILSMQHAELNGTYSILPIQPARRTDGSDDTMPFVYPDQTVYTSSEPYPPRQVDLVGQTDLAGQSWAILHLSPLQYIPYENKVILCTAMTVRITGTDGYVCGDYLPREISDARRMMYDTMVKALVVNPEAVELRCSSSLQPRGVGTGAYEYVIITNESWVDAFQPLADWKTQKGVPATIVTTSWINDSGGYTGTLVEKIRAFIEDAHTNWGAVFFLLGGDNDTVPCHYRTFPTVYNVPVPTDAYYADYDDDWFCEVAVGRASVTGPGNGNGQIGNFINKILTYERNPPLTEYAKKAAMFGFDLDAITFCEDQKIFIDDTYIPENWTMTNVYDSHTGDHKALSIVAVNAGQNLINHADHSGPYIMGTGSIKHGWYWVRANVDAFYNGDRQSILYTIGCQPGKFDEPNSIGEHFVRNAQGGGVAFIGNTCYGLYTTGVTNTLSCLFDAYFFRSLFSENWYTLGLAFCDHKNDLYPTTEKYRYLWTELTLLGDPELPVWKEDPLSLTVTHPTELPLGSSSFTVHVTAGGSPANHTLVCLWKEPEVYLTGYTDDQGDVTFTPSPSTTGEMTITVTTQNYLPYEGAAMVVEPPLLIDLRVFLEGPFNGVTMDTDLNSAGVLPLAHPYSGAPWYYTGAEAVQSIPNANIVDWVLVELRDAPLAPEATSATTIARQAAFVLNNGTIVSTDGTSLLEFTTTIANNLFVVIYHRNHLSIMSATPLLLNSTTYSYDFTLGLERAYGSMNAHKELVLGVWGMMGGDGNHDGLIDNCDKNDVWRTQSGTSGYRDGDFSLDTHVNNQDKNDIWVFNSGLSSQVPS
ncbi:MAG: hypothetical protein JXA00_05810 [Candidatus Thermoplasmatota archaeon]|nr:hypothetical protein [Candidatus Thermoplasmatota archaeon]